MSSFSDFLSNMFSNTSGGFDANQNNKLGSQVTAEDFGTNGALPQNDAFAQLLERLKKSQGRQINPIQNLAARGGGTVNIQQLRPLLQKILGRGL